MAVTVQMQFESAVTEMYQDTFVGSSIENGMTIMQFDLLKLDWQCALGTTAPICWRQEPYHVDIHELSTFHNPLKYRFIVAQGYYLNDQHQRVYFTPEIKGVSTAQHMSHSIIRLAGYLAAVCGVSLRHIALIFSSLFLSYHFFSAVASGCLGEQAASHGHLSFAGNASGVEHDEAVHDALCLWPVTGPLPAPNRLVPDTICADVPCASRRAESNETLLLRG
jgi:hypothetical protein